MSSATDLIAAFSAAIGSTNVLTAPNDMAPFLVDWHGRYHGRAHCVVRPREAGEVASIVRLCAKHDVTIVPQGGNTGMCGGATPDGSGRAVVISLSRMNRIRDLDIHSNAVTVDAGCVLADVQRAANDADRLFPMGLGSEGSCQIGGNISTNSGGTAVLRYGNMRDLVLGLEVVLPDGRIWNGLRSLRKDNTGYDLKQLFIAAEGTLGLITGAVLKLFPKPKTTTTAMAAIASVEDALRLLSELRTACGDRITAFEIMSDSQMAIVLRQIAGITNPLRSSAPFYIFMELSDTLGDFDLGDAIERALSGPLERGLISDAVIAASEHQANSIWRLRHAVSDANRKDGGVGVSHDTSVPISRLPEFISRVSAAMTEHHPAANMIYVGHIGDGNIHVVAIFPNNHFADGAAYEETAASVNGIVHDITATLGGSISAEHGIGQSNRKRLTLYKDALELEFMRGIKRLFDPRNIMNPGKVL